MSKVLHITGRTLPDGFPESIPRLNWVWEGGVRADPGQAVGFMPGDRKDGLHRLLQRPHPASRYAAPWLPPQVHTETDPPLGILGDSGILLERAATQLIDDTRYSTWTQVTMTSSVAGEVSPTGESSGDGLEAYLLTPSGTDGYIEKSVTTGTNMNVDTYVFSAWVRKPDGASGPVSIVFRAGASSILVHLDATDQWQRIVVTSPNVASTTAECRIYPGGATGHPTTIDTQPCLVWGAQLELETGSGAGIQESPASSPIDVSGSRVASTITASFVWPAPPWTLKVDYTQFYGTDSGLTFELFRGLGVGSGGTIYVFYSLNTDLIFSVLHRDNSTTVAAAIESLEWQPRTRNQVIITMDLDGNINAWTNGTGGGKIAAGVFVQSSSKQLRLGSLANGSDAILHSLEIWDRLVDGEDLL